MARQGMEATTVTTEFAFPWDRRPLVERRVAPRLTPYNPATKSRQMQIATHHRRVQGFNRVTMNTNAVARDVEPGLELDGVKR